MAETIQSREAKYGERMIEVRVRFFTDELGPVTIVGPGSGRRETGFWLLIDLLNINRKLSC